MQILIKQGPHEKDIRSPFLFKCNRHIILVLYIDMIYYQDM